MPLKCLDMWKWAEGDMRRRGLSDVENFVRRNDSNMGFTNQKRKILPRDGEEESRAPCLEASRRHRVPRAQLNAQPLPTAHWTSERVSEWMSE